MAPWGVLHDWKRIRIHGDRQRLCYRVAVPASPRRPCGEPIGPRSMIAQFPREVYSCELPSKIHMQQNLLLLPRRFIEFWGDYFMLFIAVSVAVSFIATYFSIIFAVLVSVITIQKLRTLYKDPTAFSCDWAVNNVTFLIKFVNKVFVVFWEKYWGSKQGKNRKVNRVK